MILRQARIPVPYVLATLGVLFFFILTWFFVNIQDNPLIGRLAFGTASMLFVLGAVEIERHRPLNVPGFLLAFRSVLLRCLSRSSGRTFVFDKPFVTARDLDIFFVEYCCGHDGVRRRGV